MVHDRHWAAGFLQPHARGARAGADALLLVAESGSGLPGLLHGWHGHHLLVPQAARPPLLPYTQVARVRGGVRGGYVCGAGRAHGVGVRPQIPPPAHRDAARPALVVRGLLVVTRRMDARFGDLHGQMRRPQKRAGGGRAPAGHPTHLGHSLRLASAWDTGRPGRWKTCEDGARR